jgi:MYXO-CTERM domain-containing protein
LWTLLLAAWTLLSPPTARANPAILFVDGGAGGALLPRSTQDVRIVSERLEFVESTEEGEPARSSRWEMRLPWHVRADYVLENLTAERIEADVGFPVAGDRGEWDYGGDEPASFGPERITQSFTASFHVRLDGNDLAHRLVSNECPSGQDGGTTAAAGFCYPSLFVFRLAVEPHAQASLTVEYDQAPSLCCDSEGGFEDVYGWADYILETGELWAGTIGRLDIVYRFAVPPPDGVMVYDSLVGPALPSEGPWYHLSDEGAPRGWSPRAQKVAAPEGVMDLWNPAVRFHYAFACRDGRIVLRLKATDFEPGGNISLGVQNVESRLESLYFGDRRSARQPCAASRTRESESSDPWSSWTQRVERADRLLEEPPPEWSCSFVKHSTYYRSEAPHEVTLIDYRYDCCCATAAGIGRWNPDCDKDAGGKGCAAAASTVVPAPATSPADAGAADGGKADAAPDAAAQDAAAADDVREAVPEPVPDEAGSAVADAAPSSPADASGPESGSGTGTATATPASAVTREGADASPAPAGKPSKKGCGCAVAGAGGAAWSGLGVLGALLLMRLRRRRRVR